MRRVIVVGLLLVAACGDDSGGDPDARVIDAEPPGIDANPEMPLTLAETGLCVDAGCTQISADVHEFAPEWILWSDGAAKRRWIYLPPGTQIDSSNMDLWQFPEGTKLWKEFTRDTTRVETRLLQKIGPEEDDWYYAAFVWNEAQTEAVATPNGVENALGTEHDVPTRADCRNCHDPLPSRVLGFGAITLDHDGPGLTLDDLVAMDWLTDEPTNAGTPDAPSYFPLPGNAVAQKAMGYLHVNCGNCHNVDSPVHNNVAVEWRLTVGTLGDYTQTPIYLTARNVDHQLPLDPATAILEPGAPGMSAAYLRMDTTNVSIMMPKVGREQVDEDALADLAAWINDPDF